jgi:hypothetical protein
MLCGRSSLFALVATFGGSSRRNEAPQALSCQKQETACEKMACPCNQGDCMLGKSGGQGGGRPLAGSGVRRGSALDPLPLFLSGGRVGDKQEQ